MDQSDRERGDNIHREKQKAMDVIAKMAEAIEIITEWQHRYLHYLEYLSKEEKELDEKAAKENAEKKLGMGEWPRLKPKRKRKQEGKE